MIKLYNLIYEDKYFVSCIAPSKLPEKNFCYIEIIFDEKKGNIESVTGILQEGQRQEERKERGEGGERGEGEEEGEEARKESILSDLDVSPYIKKLREFLRREDVDKDKIHLNFVETVENEEERILKVMVILLSSYLIYFNFMQLPYVVSLELLNNEKFQYFTAFSSTNPIEEIFILHVSTLHRFFSDVFKEEKKDEKEDENLIEEIKEYKRRMFIDIDKKLSILNDKFDQIEELKMKLSSIFKNF
jgi:hypothetical protein